jgi:hypothetical protein
MHTRHARKTVWLISLVAALGGLLTAPATTLGQALVFMREEGDDPNEWPPGSDIYADPGEQVTVFVWLEDPVGIGNLNAYQIIIPWFATGGDEGVVSYVDVNSGSGGGNSIFLDQNNPQWVFFNHIPAGLLPTYYNETPGGSDPHFGLIFNFLPGVPIQIGPGSDVPNPGGPNYLFQFDLQSSSDACGTFTLSFNFDDGFWGSNEPPFSTLFNQYGGPYGNKGDVFFLSLSITIGDGPCSAPSNDLCTDATNLGGNLLINAQYNTYLASPDADPDGCDAGANDVWYEYTAPVACQPPNNLSATIISGGGTLTVYDAEVGCTPSADDELSCGGGSGLDPDAEAGDTYLIRVSGNDVHGTLQVACAIECFADAHCADQDPCTADDCSDYACAHAPLDCEPRVFMLEAGADLDAAPLQTTAVFADPGELISVFVWLQDPMGLDLLSGYQIFLPWFASGGDGGSVAYVDLPAPGGNSVNLDTTNPDWVFSNVPGAAFQPPTFVESGSHFGVLYEYLPGVGIPIGPGSGVPNPGAPNYLMQFQLQVSADACGTFTLPFSTAPARPPHAAILNPSDGPYGGPGSIRFDALQIILSPLNDDCADAALFTGSMPYDTTCATQDGPTDCGTGGDVWYEVTAPIDCDLSVDVTGSGSVATYLGADCTPAGPGICGTISGQPVSAGTHILVQVSGDSVSGVVHLGCGGCISSSDCSDFNPCTTDTCNINWGYCSNAPNTLPCNDGNVCTIGDYCSGGSCAPGSVRDCTDLNSCTEDSCDPGAGGDGCVNENVDGQPCNDDGDCASGGCVDGICDCQPLPNLNLLNTLCLDVRGCDNEGPAVGGLCESQDSECAGGPAPDGVLQCSDNDANPLNGAICVDQCCYMPGGSVVIDVELGPTPQGVCGTQMFLDYDEACLTLESLTIDPDDETGLDFVIANDKNPAVGEIDLAVSLAPGTICGPPGVNPGVPNDSVFVGGTVARLTFSASGACKCGVSFRPHNPPTLVSGPKGDLETLILCPADDIQIQGPPVITCPDDSADHAVCGDIFRTVTYGPVTVTDECEEITADISELCAVEFRKACDDHLDCGRGALCGPSTNCISLNGPGSICWPDPLVEGAGFVCNGVKCTGYCTLDGCIAGACQDPRDTETLDLDDFLDCSDGCVLPPGEVTINCSYTNSCGRTAECDSSHFNSGLNRLCVDLELSPHMLPGNANDPITRCINLEIAECGAAGFPVCNPPYGSGGELCSPLDENACGGHPEACHPPAAANTVTISQEVVLGLPEHLAGHGTVCVDVPPGNWICLTATDPKHSLSATCTVECTDDNVLHAAFKGSKDSADTCHSLVQGNLSGDDSIDIADYTIMAGEYLANYNTSGNTGEDSPCKTEPVEGNNFHADFNGDGLVTLADWTFVVFNFFNTSKDPCSVVCGDDGGAAQGARPAKPRASMTRSELERAGLGSYVGTADANGDGVVNLGDMRLLLDMLAIDSSGGEVTVENLRDAARRIERSHRSRELLPRSKRGN